MCDNATNLNIHVEKDTFRNCLEFYLNKNKKREDERKGNMKDNKIFQSRNLQEHKRGVHIDKNRLNEFEMQKYKK